MSTGTEAIQDYLDSTDKQAIAATTAASNRDKHSAPATLTSSTTSSVTTSTNDALASNPIVNGGTDIINSVVTTAVQGLVGGALHAVTGALKPLQTASDTFFTVLALASTASVEIAMELARGNARLIVTTINQKTVVINQIQTEITALYNAMAILLNSSPFFDAYLRNLIAAYNDIQLADNDLKSVVAVLKTQNPFYNNVLFNQALALLNTAESLILPSQTTDISSIRSNVLQAVSSAVAQAEKTKAAVIALMAISAQIAVLMVQYASLTLQINELVALFLSALSGFISSYKRNSNIDNATINHINSATGQLDALLASMSTLLFPSVAEATNPLHTINVTSNATVWGIKLAAIIEFLKINPGTASQNLNVTGESVRRYNQAIALLNGYGDRRYGSATLKVTASQEDFLNTGSQVVRFLYDANTVVASTRDPRNVRAEILQFMDLIQAAKSLDTDIVSALTPFINTPNNLIAGANTVVGNLSKMAQGLGLDRAASLIAKGDVTSLLTCNANTATYVGAALVGVRSIITAVNASPNATDQDKGKLSKIDSDLSSHNAVKQVEATRSATDSTATFVANTNAQTAQTNQDGQTAMAIASKYSPTESASTSDVTTINGQLKDVNGTAFSN